MSIFSQTLDADRRATLIILVTLRWFLIAASFYVVNYHHGTSALQLVALNLLALAAVALNAAMHGLLITGRTIPTLLVATSSLYDAAAITGAVGLVDGFDNPSFILFYPALLGFALMFPGRRTFLYASSVMAAYGLIVFEKDSSFNGNDAIHQKAIVLRLATMAATALAAHMVVRIERTKRQQAVAAEAERAAELLALERRGRELEQMAYEERRRLSQEIHDGVSQGVYVLSLSLDSMGKDINGTNGPDVAERLAALGRLAKQTLLETRHVLVDLERVISGQSSLAVLLRNQAREFSTVTGIRASVEVTGEEQLLPGSIVAEVYRIVQEGLANIYKHSQAETATLRLTFDEGTLSLEIVDDGIGFEAANPPEGGRGLTNMRERTERVGGQFAIKSQAGAGTRLTCSIPLGDADKTARPSQPSEQP